MKIDMVLRADLDTVADEARQLHAMGFDGVYTQEANSDVTFPLLLAAQAAPIDIYTNVAIAFPRSPDAPRVRGVRPPTSGEGASLSASGARSVLTSRSASAPASATRSPHARSWCAALHAIFRCFHEGERLDFRGEYYTHTLMTPTFIPPRLAWDPPPIWVGALGPRMTQMAAEVADGVLIHPFNSERFLRSVTLPRIEAGLAASGRDRARLHARRRCHGMCLRQTRRNRSSPRTAADRTSRSTRRRRRIESRSTCMDGATCNPSSTA